MDTLDEPRPPEWKAIMDRLEAAYRKDGRQALEQMEGVEPLALWNEMVRDYKILGRQLEAAPGDRDKHAAQQKLLTEINDIGGWINAKQRAFRQSLQSSKQHEIDLER